MCKRSSSHRILPLLFALAMAAPPASARLPDPDTIYWGELRHRSGVALVPLVSEQIMVIARLDGVTIATFAVEPGTSVFVLKVPMDDGEADRLPGSARRGERVRIFLRSNPLDSEYETNESADHGGLLVAGSKGEVLYQDLSVAADLSSGSDEAMAMWLAYYGLPENSGLIDSDSDGFTNAEEFAAGTDPTDPNDFFRILEVLRTAENDLIKFGPVRPGRLYTLWCSETLDAGDWSDIGQIVPEVSAESFQVGHPAPAAPRMFYRLQVEMP